MRRVLLAAVVAVAAAAAVGLLLGSDDGPPLRRVGLPAVDDTVATLLDDGTPVFVARDGAERVRVIDARTPRRAAPDGAVALPDLVDGLVAWCKGHGYVDDLAPAATFTPEGAANSATDTGLAVYEIVERHRAHVMVGEATPAGVDGDGSPEAVVAGCDDPERTDDHGQAMFDAEVDAIPAGSSWVVRAAVDLAAGVVCAPPDDPLAWPLCPDGGVDAQLPQRRPTPTVAEAHGERYADRDAFGFVGRVLVTRADEDGPLERVWRLPYGVELRAEPTERIVEARLRLTDDASDTVTGEPPLATVVLADADAAGDPPSRLPLEPVTEVRLDDAAGPMSGDDAAAALRTALDADPDGRWRLTVRADPLRPPRLVRLERLP